MRSKITDEDVAWLEHRLSAALAPVNPRAEFVNNARRALLSADPDEREAKQPYTLLPLIAMVFTLVGVALLAAALRRRGYWK
jgi:hypothetical protein